MEVLMNTNAAFVVSPNDKLQNTAVWTDIKAFLFLFFFSWFTDSSDPNFGHFQKNFFFFVFFFPLRCAFLSK